MKYTCVRQTEQADCGAAALATVCLHHGRQVSLPKLRDLAGVDKIGASMAGLKRAAEALGFVATGVKGGWGALGTVPLPAIAHVRNAEGLGHFVVMHRVDGTRAIVADPARGLVTLTRQQFESMWTTRLLLLAPQPEFRRQASSDAPARSPIGRLLALLAPNTGVLARVGLLAVLLTVLGLLPAVFVRVLVDDVLPGAQLGVLDMLGIGMIIVLAFRVVFSALREYFVTHLGRRIDLQMQSQYLRHVLALPLRFFETKRTGDIMSRMLDVAKVNAVVGGVALGALVDVLLLAVFIAIMFHFDWRLAAVSCAFIPVLIGALYLHQRALVAGSRDMMEHGARLQSRLVEDLGGVATLRACGAIDQRAHRLDERLVDSVQARFRVRLLGLSMTSTETLVSGAASLVVLWYGGHLVVGGDLSIGSLMFFNTLLAQMLVPLRSLTSANLTVQEGLVALERLGEVVDLDREIDPGARVCPPPPMLQHGITFEQTTFDYGNRGSRKVLDNLDVVIPAGRTTAFVGTSGCGKSTILRLLMGFYRPTAGRVAIDGIDLRDVDLERWRMGVSWVPQDPTVFDGSIADNVALGDANVDLGKVVAACRLGGLADLVETLPDRYETTIGERGTSLSGGQRQLLAIARAIYRNAPIVVFDEATSMLDAGTERALRDRLAPWLAGRTVVIVAHRLATVRSADWIYVMGGGRLVEGGTHPTLMAQQGAYAAYWRDQNGGVDVVPAAPVEAARPALGLA